MRAFCSCTLAPWLPQKQPPSGPLHFLFPCQETQLPVSPLLWQRATQALPSPHAGLVCPLRAFPGLYSRPPNPSWSRPSLPSFLFPHGICHLTFCIYLLTNLFSASCTKGNSEGRAFLFPAICPVRGTSAAGARCPPLRQPWLRIKPSSHGSTSANTLLTETTHLRVGKLRHRVFISNLCKVTARKWQS